jgi:hypothetical protein
VVSGMLAADSVGFRAKRPPAGSRLRCDSKQDREFDLFRPNQQEMATR